MPLELVCHEAEGWVLTGHIWHVFPNSCHKVAIGKRPHIQDTEFAFQLWHGYVPLPDRNGTACLVADFEQNGCLILSEAPVPPDVPAHYVCEPAELPEDWTFDDGKWKLFLEVGSGTVPFSSDANRSCVVFGPDEVQVARIHAHKSGASVYLWLNCEGWAHLGPVLSLKLEDDPFLDEDGNLIARKDGDNWFTPGRFAGSRWRIPVITSTPKHPHPNHG